MPDLSGLIDMDYFWWVFNKIIQVGIIFVVIFVAVSMGGFVLETIIAAFRRMRG